METAMQGVSAGADSQLSWVVGWMVQWEKPSKEEIEQWGSGLSVNSDIFAVVGGGVIHSFSSDVGGVYVGLGIGGGPGASFQYKVW